MAWFHYSQNNSGGSFDFNETAGITHHVVIEADSPAEADERLEGIGGYFNGCNSGRDCSCCGDRWCSAYTEGDETPKVYDDPVAKATAWSAWMEDGKEIAVHHKSGDIEWFGVKVSKGL